MAALPYSGRIVHTEKTIQRLYKTQYYAYEKLHILLRLALGMALVLIAVMASLPTWARVMLLLPGTWLLASRDFPASVRADRVLAERKAKLPRMDYRFAEDHVHLEGEGSMDIPYSRFTRLAEDPEYLYLFVSRDSVCMVERASLKPPSVEDFMAFIAEKTGLSWRREKAFLSMNIYDIRQMILDARKK